MLEKYRARLDKSEFYKSIFTLMTGTALSQIIPLAITPILTRLYTPDDFGLLALYLSTVSILTLVATGNYEKAIIMPKQDRDAVGIIKLAFLLSVSASLTILLLTIFLREQIARFYNNPKIIDLLFFVPFSVFSLAIYNIINTWFNRVKQYSVLSYNRVTKSSLSSVFSIAFGISKLATIGLIFSEFLGQLFATILFGRSFYRTNRGDFIATSKADMIRLAKDYKKFPQFSLPADLLSMGSYQLPIFLFSKFFTQAVVGYYSLCIRVLDKPFIFFTNAVYEVFRQKAMEDYNRDGNCRSIYIKTFKRLLVISLPIMSIFIIASPLIFKVVFGNEWEVAGHYARIISVMYIFKFVASPLSFMFYVANKQRLDFLLHVYVFLSSCLILTLSFKSAFTIEKTLILFVLNYSLVYIFYIFKSYQFANGKA
ncbi:lipopolysaccharide biosynthesis protein [Chryseotalea sanaruensis]|uniref:lipopolysaccharide biosynthesis protein n=1 Tax=Chryseotalea sanaruensis TaxID=2482724 RepID=UPI000F8F0567|nr:oligosaccharide flippase family protein [Chryseotalea sanaruensis]